jgi:hypothetical protein
VAAALVVVGVIVGVKAVTNVRRAQAAAPAVLDTAFGPIRADAFVASLYAAVRRHLAHEADGRALAYSYPDDAWLYLTLPAHDATRFDILLLSFPRRYVDEVVGVLRARVPGTVVLFRPIPAGDIRDAVEAGYERVEELGAFQIYVRRGSAAAGATSRESSLSVVKR